ncbi:hypothetical protein HKX48_002990, partial [Thoreauomyces humboldtii]
KLDTPSSIFFEEDWIEEDDAGNQDRQDALADGVEIESRIIPDLVRRHDAWTAAATSTRIAEEHK